jgi:hypothetical protein
MATCAGSGRSSGESSAGVRETSGRPSRAAAWIGLDWICKQKQPHDKDERAQARTLPRLVEPASSPSSQHMQQPAHVPSPAGSVCIPGPHMKSSHPSRWAPNRIASSAALSMTKLARPPMAQPWRAGNWRQTRQQGAAAAADRPWQELGLEHHPPTQKDPEPILTRAREPLACHF